VLKKLPWKRILAVAGALAFVYVVVKVVLAGSDMPQLPPAQNGISLKGGHVNGNRVTTKAWTFDYESAQLSADGSTGSVQGVHDGVVYKKGKPYLKVSAQQISIDTNSLNFTAIGKVHASLIGDKEKRSFDTDLIVWTNGAKELRMDHPAYLHSADQTLELQSVTIDFDTDQIHLGSIAGGLVAPKP
jgi:hypothetical protein